VPEGRKRRFFRVHQTQLCHSSTSIQERRGLFWVRHEHLFRAKNRQNRKFYNRLATKDMLRVFMGSTRPPSLRFGAPWSGAGRDVGPAKSARFVAKEALLANGNQIVFYRASGRCKQRPGV